MLYLEDYLEMIEHLPQELRDRFTEVREMDLQVHNAMDNLDEEVKVFFNSAKRMKEGLREDEYKRIRKEYERTLEDAEEKCNITNQMYDLVNRYLTRLDQELEKFKNELEADNAGITEVLERRSHELDQQTHHSSLPLHQILNNSISSNNNSSVPRKKYSLSSGLFPRDGHSAGEFGRSFSSSSATANGNAGLTLSQPSSAPLTLYSANNPIAAAASQAIAATQQMQSGRRTASLKASIDAITSGSGLGSSSFSNFAASENFQGTGFSGHFGAFGLEQNPPNRANKRMRSSSQFHDSDSSEGLRIFDSNGDPLATSWNPEPDEQTYCICNQVSYGEMVACDNEDCEIEWFHYACVALNAAPKGKWYCPQCVNRKKRRASERT